METQVCSSSTNQSLKWNLKYAIFKKSLSDSETEISKKEKCLRKTLHHNSDTHFLKTDKHQPQISDVKSDIYEKYGFCNYSHINSKIETSMLRKSLSCEELQNMPNDLENCKNQALRHFPHKSRTEDAEGTELLKEVKSVKIINESIKKSLKLDEGNNPLEIKCATGYQNNCSDREEGELTPENTTNETEDCIKSFKHNKDRGESAKNYVGHSQETRSGNGLYITEVLKCFKDMANKISELKRQFSQLTEMIDVKKINIDETSCENFIKTDTSEMKKADHGGKNKEPLLTKSAKNQSISVKQNKTSSQQNKSHKNVGKENKKTKGARKTKAREDSVSIIKYKRKSSYISSDDDSNRGNKKIRRNSSGKVKQKDADKGRHSLKSNSSKKSMDRRFRSSGRELENKRIKGLFTRQMDFIHKYVVQSDNRKKLSKDTKDNTKMDKTKRESIEYNGKFDTLSDMESFLSFLKREKENKGNERKIRKINSDSFKEKISASNLSDSKTKNDKKYILNKNKDGSIVAQKAEDQNSTKKIKNSINSKNEPTPNRDSSKFLESRDSQKTCSKNLKSTEEEERVTLEDLETFVEDLRQMRKAEMEGKDVDSDIRKKQTRETRFLNRLQNKRKAKLMALVTAAPEKEARYLKDLESVLVDDQFVDSYSKDKKALLKRFKAETDEIILGTDLKYKHRAETKGTEIKTAKNSTVGKAKEGKGFDVSFVLKRSTVKRGVDPESENSETPHKKLPLSAESQRLMNMFRAKFKAKKFALT